jgi:hypothetical protein
VPLATFISPPPGDPEQQGLDVKEKLQEKNISFLTKRTKKGKESCMWGWY